jgi:AbrB family looped-hinge helix DNA binding protein
MKKYGPYRLQKTFSVVTVPSEVRKKLDIKAGDLVIWIIDDEDRCMLKKVSMRIE